MRARKPATAKALTDRHPAPAPVTVASFNLHGTQDNDRWRFQEIARVLLEHRVEICGFQEVIKGGGIEDTSYQVARCMKDCSEDTYQTWWAYCHPFYGRYPEGISILSRLPMENPAIIDLNVTIKKGIKPILPRFAVAAEFRIGEKLLLFATLHLDHHHAATLRTAQAVKLLRGLTHQYGQHHHHATILTGDFNAREQSMAMRYLRRRGFKDTYREIHATGGATFPSHDPLERIDYIMMKGTMHITSSYLVMKGNALSDHLGIITIIE
jgi:endonuclease/exonuclease/phosphatase family metal-dependent hydrolase